MRVFVCSPFGGSAGNIELAKRYCREVIDSGHTPFAPHLLYPQILVEALANEREIGINCGIEFLRACDFLYVFTAQGISPGMQREINFAKAHGIPVFHGEAWCPPTRDQVLGEMRLVS